MARCEVVDLDDVGGADRHDHDVVVVIDVIRAFTTAVAAFERGAAEIRCVAGLDEARALAASLPGSVLMGEERGRRPDGFDAGNSPDDLDALDLTGRLVVQRTTNGTRGLARFASAPVLLAAAAVNAGATARWIRERGPASVLLIATGTLAEDRACADHLAASIHGHAPDRAALAEAVRSTGAAHIAGWSRARDGAERASFEADLAACAEVDRSDLVLRGVPDGRAVRLRPTTDRR